VYPDKDLVVINSVTTRCTLNRAFGHDGATTVSVPTELVRKGRGHALWVDAIAPTRAGGALLSGTYRGRWVVAELTPRGHLHRKFGDRGWVPLPYHGEATALLQEPSGRIVVAGDNGGGGCCTVNHAVALSPQGRPIRRFGKNGRVTLPTGEDSGVASLKREPDGKILAEIRYGNMGCWGVALAMLTPSGRQVDHFAARMRQFWSAQGFGTFVGDVYVDGRGFILLGHGQRECVGPSFSSEKDAVRVLARFHSDGTIVRQDRPVPSKLYGVISAFALGRETLLAESPLTDNTYLWLRAVRRNGTTDTSFGKNGHVLVRTPWRGSDAILTNVFVAKVSRRSIVLVASVQTREVAVIRLHV
jgi:hypothetical protein